jgi:hypothetical protein
LYSAAMRSGRRREGLCQAAQLRQRLPVATETGNANFTFALPVVGMPGRGLGLSLSLVYNSRLWNKSTDGTYTYMTYDVDSGWPSQGFRLSFGQSKTRALMVSR